MSVSVEFLPGPLTSEESRTSAENALRQHPAIRKGAAYALEQLEGRWIAAVIHEGGEPPFAGGGPADADEALPGPKSEGPDDVEPSEGEEGPPKPEGEESGDSDSDGPKKDKGGEKGEVHHVLELLQSIAEALGIPVGLGGGDELGPEGIDPDAGGPPAPPGGPPHGGPPGLGGPEGPEGPGGVPAVQKVIHDRVTKPGETPPGGTPLGAPAFSSVRQDHPWTQVLGKVASFQVADKIGDTPLPKIRTELESLAAEGGYKVARFREDRDVEGDRIAVAVITKH